MYLPRRVYLDHNATTPVDPAVAEAMAVALRDVFGNPASLHTEGRKAEGVLRRARSSVARLLGCPEERVFFVGSGSEANNTAILGVFSARGSKGHVVTTRIEHESVLGACAEIERRGGQVTYLAAGRDGRVEARQVQEALRPDTVLVSVMHANNETGALQPVEEIGRLCREAGVPLHTDAVQSFGKIRTDVDALGCELLSLTAHKINGPKGAAALYWRGVHACEPLIRGGDQEGGMRAGTVAVHQVAGLGKAAELRYERWRGDLERLRPLRAELIRGLREAFPAARVNGAEGEGRQLPGTVNVTFPAKNGLHLLAALDCYEISVSIGSACTADRIEPSHVLLGMGLSREDALSSIRLSMGGGTGKKDIAHVLKMLPRVLQGDPPGFAYLDPQHLTRERLTSKDVFLIDISMPTTRLTQRVLREAHRFSYFSFDKHLPEIPRDKEALLICDTGAFSLMAGYRLAQQGHSRVRVVFGGYGAWRALHPRLVEELCG
ncbi:MAG: aminotransferase class V-fold PLP-dependent enzyme [Deltaproteobacteria bacterium]|nr:aminotransferase class V-fold PLP-dependent enzyme [Deltaproteobacteria bacterium]